MSFVKVMCWLMYACMIVGASQRSVWWLLFAIALVAFWEFLSYLFERVSNREAAQYDE